MSLLSLVWLWGKISLYHQDGAAWITLKSTAHLPSSTALVPFTKPDNHENEVTNHFNLVMSVRFHSRRQDCIISLTFKKIYIREHKDGCNCTYNLLLGEQIWSSTASQYFQNNWRREISAAIIYLCCGHLFRIPGHQGAVSIRKTVLPGMAIPMLKIRRPNGRLIFNMEIAIRRKDGLYIETGPRFPGCGDCLGAQMGGRESRHPSRKCSWYRLQE